LAFCGCVSHPLPPFELLAPLARGGMAEVWQGRHIDLDLPVAVKVVDAARANDAEFQQLFAEEVRAVASLDHPGVVWVHDYGRIPQNLGAASGGRLVPGSPYLVMELATGPSLSRWRPPDWPALRDLLQRLLAALAHCHARGVVHRDLKPSNVLPFGGTDERPEWKLTDFGIAWLGAQRDKGKRGVAVGSPSTMAPEQATAQWRDLGPGTDLYALGCIAWWLSTGHPPFRGADPLETMKMQVYEDLPPFRPTLAVPPGFSLWLRTLLQKRPEDRMACAADAIEALSRVEGEPSVVEFHPRPRRKIQLLGAGLGLYGLRPVPLVGRRQERHALQSAFGKVASGSGALTVVLHGEAGLGKSRLARWAAERGAEEGLSDVVHVTHGATPGPNDGLAGAIARHTGTLGMERTDRIQRLERLLERALPNSPREAHALAELIEPASDEERDEDRKHVALGSAEARHAIARRYLELRAAQRPVLLIIDDIHRHADSAAFVHSLLAWQEVRPSRILVVGTARSDERLLADVEANLDLLLAHPRTRSLHLGPLEDADLTELVEGLLLLDKSLAHQVVKRAEGNPMFAVELVGDWVERGVLRPTLGGWRLARGERAPIPDDLQDLWLTRVDAVLGESDRSDRVSVELAAALGQEFDTSDWVAACRQLGLVPRPDPLSALADARLLERTQAGWRFVHGLLVEALRRRAATDGRALRQHAACAAALRGRSSSPSRELRHRIAVHMLGAHRHAEALPLLESIASELESVAEPGQLAAVLDAMDQAVEALGPVGGDDTTVRAMTSLWIHRARLALFQARAEDARRSILGALDMARSGGWADLELRALLQAAIVSLVGGKPEAAENFARDGLALAEERGDRWRRARLLHRMATAANLQGRPEKSVRLYGEARLGYQEVGDPFLEAYMLVGLAHALARLERVEEAEALLHESILANRRLGQQMRCGDAHVLLGEFMRQQGRDREARENYQEGTRLYRAVGNWIGLPSVLANLAVMAMKANNHTDAEPLLDEALTILRASPRSQQRTLIEVLRVANLANVDRWDPAQKRLAEFDKDLRERNLADGDTAWALEVMGDRGMSDHTELARTAYSLAEWMFLELGRMRDARRISSKLE
jgi:eukaryotic-like serine/threonine-protein kinase